MRPRVITAMLATAALAGGLLVGTPAASANQAPRPLVSGWFGWWASDAQVAQMTSQSKGVVGEVAMFWWTFKDAENPLCIYDNVDQNGNNQWGDPICGNPTSPPPATTWKFDKQRKALQAAGIKVNASITDLNPSTKGKLSAYLDSDANRKAYAKLITDSAVNAGVDGIDLDWENFAFNDGSASWSATKPRWVAMIEELSKQLKAKGLTLWATVPAGYSPTSDSSGYWVYAWAEIAPYVDRLNLMAYDYHWDRPGPIGPNDWAARIAAGAAQQVGAANASKVWIGVPQYGRNWPVKSGDKWVVKDCPADWKPTSSPSRSSVTPVSARSLAERQKVTPTWNGTFGEWTFDYWITMAGKSGSKARDCAVKRTVWFGDTRSAVARAKIVPKTGIGGIAVWDFGTVTSDFYPKLLKYGRSIALATTTVTVKAPKTAAAGTTVKVRVATKSSAGPAAGAEATLSLVSTNRSRTRTPVATITLKGDGTGVFRVPATASGEWVVSVAGSDRRAAADSAPVATRVSYGVTAQANRTSVSRGASVTLTGTVTPASAGTVVTVQRRIGNQAWSNVRTAKTKANGTVRVKVKQKAKGNVSYRLVVPKSGRLAEGASASIVVTVK